MGEPRHPAVHGHASLPLLLLQRLEPPQLPRPDRHEVPRPMTRLRQTKGPLQEDEVNGIPRKLNRLFQLTEPRAFGSEKVPRRVDSSGPGDAQRDVRLRARATVEPSEHREADEPRDKEGRTDPATDFRHSRDPDAAPCKSDGGLWS